MELVLANCRIIDSDKDFLGNITITDGIISKVENIDKNKQDYDKSKANIIDMNGQIVMPSFVDLHAHFREPGLTHKEDIISGSNAASLGGYTFCNLMPNTKPCVSNMEIVNANIKKAKDYNKIDIHQAVSITNNFDGSSINHLEQLDNKIVKAISEDGYDVKNAKVMFDAMKIAKEKDFVVMCHCEDPDFSKTNMRFAEDLMTQRNIYLAKKSGAKTHICHVSTKDSMQFIINAKKDNKNISCEVTPHHIYSTCSTTYKVNPPLREKEDVSFLIEAIASGFVDCIATDHAPHTQEDKENGAAGMVGLETAFAICNTVLVKQKFISLCKLSNLMSKRPAEIIRINKGRIQKSYDADLVVVDPDQKWIVKKEDFASRGKNTAFDGAQLYGKVKAVIKGGQFLWKEF